MSVGKEGTEEARASHGNATGRRAHAAGTFILREVFKDWEFF